MYIHHFNNPNNNTTIIKEFKYNTLNKTYLSNAKVKVW